VESLSRWFEKLLLDESDPGGAALAGAESKVVTVIGSGGKTSLVWHLARNLPQNQVRKILVTTTTKMLLPETEEIRFNYCDGTPPAPVRGITLAGIFNKKTAKLESLALPELERISGGYDLVLIEGDGSRQLPLKGWADHEPVVPCFTGITVGMLPLWPLGMPATEKIIHHLPLFCALTGASPGEILRVDHLAALISGKKTAALKSLFSAAWGKKILFINQIENDAAFAQACGLSALLPLEFRSGLYKIIAGSVRQDTVLEV
jgi:probable selenium-dependent hydroxylase accessory protein YqeC